ncbi:MAG: rod shape-determining protein RodA [Endomicrobium sp.]|jgi:rod shape determining protein RodA|nr:rod shape-determining protein RodA [Endomicrobium sp.]
MSEKKLFLKRIVLNIDWFLIICAAALITIGMLAIYSGTLNFGISSKYIAVQSMAISIGVCAMAAFILFNYQYYRQFDNVIYVLSLLLLTSVLVFGVTVKGTRGWFNFGFASFQPVEIAKLMYIVVIAAFLDKKSKDAKKASFLFIVFSLLMGHLALIMMQPDFSSTLSYFPVTLVLLFAVGVEPFYLLCIVIFGAFAVGIPLFSTFIKLQADLLQSGAFTANFLLTFNDNFTGVYLIIALISLILFIWWFMWKLRVRIPVIYPVILCSAILLGCAASVPVEKSLKEYQRKRLIVFLNPKVDPKGSGYNIIQSKIAIGSGRLAGKGFTKGTQTQLGFLPEQHTDFIFSVIGEEGGWVISQLVILFYFIFIWRALIIAKDARDRYGSLIALGLASMFTFYAFINIGMVMGIMPVTGMPLLLLSYGGSSMVSSLCAIGILLSIQIRRHTYY